MGSKRRRWTPQEKLRLVLESLQSDQKVAELCRREGLSPTQLYDWRKQLLGSAAAVFADQRGRRGGEDPRLARLSADNQRMKDVIAEITAENLVLKKGSSRISGEPSVDQGRLAGLLDNHKLRIRGYLDLNALPSASEEPSSEEPGGSGCYSSPNLPSRAGPDGICPVGNSPRNSGKNRKLHGD